MCRKDVQRKWWERMVKKFVVWRWWWWGEEEGACRRGHVIGGTCTGGKVRSREGMYCEGEAIRTWDCDKKQRSLL